MEKTKKGNIKEWKAASMKKRRKAENKDEMKGGLTGESESCFRRERNQQVALQYEKGTDRSSKLPSLSVKSFQTYILLLV
ncbi:hypothetical protein C1H46_038788 [Malus baccata]|uniref:Uncharacterized protein n=1 Tax=Malus baccata TaxID=106549 RepID=A0A540KN77_MALBA|nr:hypothetical protein C1H46_038788 [Malus baccata]